MVVKEGTCLRALISIQAWKKQLAMSMKVRLLSITYSNPGEALSTLAGVLA